MLSLIKVASIHKLVHKKGFPILVIAGAGFILSIPVVLYGIPFFSDDGVTHHAVWYTHFAEQFWAGDIYPRWLMDMNGGLGSPVFFYYPPLPYFLTSLLKPFFPNDPYGWYQLGLSASLALTASGLCAYLWLKEMTNRGSALVAAILYMATPYHLASDLYIRSSLAEYWAFVWMPLILFFVHKIVKGHRLSVAGLAVSYALLVMTHLPTTLIFSFIPICYAFFTSSTGRKLKTAAIITGAMALGTGLSAVYLWPALTTQQFVFLDRMSTGYFSYKNWLLFSNFSLWRDEKLPLLLLTLNLAVIACCAFIITRFNPNKFIRRINAFWLVVVTVSVLMMTGLSRPIWLIFPTLQMIQFPWRFNAIISLAITALLALSIFSATKSKSVPLKLTKAIALVLIAAWIPVTCWAVCEAYSFSNHTQEEVNYKKREIEQSREVPEYYPRWNAAMSEFDWEASNYEEGWDGELNKIFESLLQRVGDTGGSLSKVKIVEGAGQIAINSWKPREISLHIETPTGMKLYVSQFYYPNWTAHLIEESSSLDVQPSQPDGLISLSIPEGNHQVLLVLERSKAEDIGRFISLISIVLILSFIVAIKRQQNRPLRFSSPESTKNHNS
ncbi:MAG TPA: 6-pyruvoyl-tetrahydropterin synthase-related protein [Pyrinomonadaceae bacterium]|nr:6-pyruvoyl-tetrahydropterin synthase-related protein [Pyrinomonadaceae bacterium]